MLEAELVGVDADEAPDGEDEYPEHVEAEHLRSAAALVACRGKVGRVKKEAHSFGGDLETLLDEPEKAALTCRCD